MMDGFLYIFIINYIVSSGKLFAQSGQDEQHIYVVWIQVQLIMRFSFVLDGDTDLKFTMLKS